MNVRTYFARLWRAARPCGPRGAPAACGGRDPAGRGFTKLK